MKAGRAWFLAFGLLVVARPGPSQTMGSIEGRVLDGEARPLAGVPVTVRSPSLQGARTVSTDRDGRFRLPALPPGDYSVRAELEGSHPAEQSGLKVAIDRGLTVELRMLSAFREEIRVVGVPPILDVTSTATSTIVEPKLFLKLPTTRTFSGLVYLAPGVVDSGRNSYPAINGASLAENRYFVDGLDITDPVAGTLESSLPVDFLEEVEIKTGGFAPEYGGALGGILNVVTKSGSNDLHGGAFGYYKDDGLKSDPPENVRNERLLATREYEAGFTLGGRIIRDRLWYFLGLDPTYRDTEWTTQQAFRVTDQSDSVYYSAKLTGQIHPSHQLVLSAFGDPNDASLHSLDAAGIIRDDTTSRRNHLILSYHGAASRSVWLEAQAGRYEQERSTAPAADGPFYIDLAGGQFARAENCGDPNLIMDGVLFSPGCRGGTVREDQYLTSRDEVRGAATALWKTGALSHELKAGGGWRRARYETTLHFPGPAPGPFADRNGNVLNPRGVSGQVWLLFPDSVELVDFDLDSFSESAEGAFFLQDRLRVNEHLTLDLGIRADSFESTGERTQTDPNLRLKFGFGDMIAPRIGAAWDFTGSSRSKIFARYGRSYESVPLALNSFAFAFDKSYFYDFKYPANGGLPSTSNVGELIAFGPNGGQAEHVQRDLKPMYGDDYALGVEYQIGSDVSVGLTGIYRKVGNVFDDMSIDGGRTFFIANPGGTIRVHPVTGAPLAAPIFVPEPVREYRALQVAFQKRLRNDWQLSASYVYSRLEGNYGGAIHENLQFTYPNFTEAFDRPEFLANTSGLLPNDRTHQAKLYGSYEWGFGLITGLVAQYLSGTPISKRGSFLGRGGRGQRLIVERGSAGRTPDVYTIDLHLAYPLPLGRAFGLDLFADIFNVTDNQRATTVDQIWTLAAAATTVNPNECGGPGTGTGTACPQGNPNWGGPLTFQDPRTLRLGMRLSW